MNDTGEGLPPSVLHVSHSDIDGGAARGAYWLHRALLKAGIASTMLVEAKSSDDYTVIGKKGLKAKILNAARRYFDNAPLRMYQARDEYIYSTNWMPTRLLRPLIDRMISADILHLHWVANGTLNLNELSAVNQPIVWTLRDMWPFTGGCHYAGACDKYTSGCGACPHLASKLQVDLSAWNFQRKSRLFQRLNMTAVALSNWMADCASDSPLFANKRIEVIPNAIDELVFKPFSKMIAREILGIDSEKRIILFGAIDAIDDKRKGFEYLLPAIRQLGGGWFGERAEVYIFGSSEPSVRHDFGLKHTYFGKVNNDLVLSLLYSAADVTVCPSTQEAFGKTAMESLACGTPVVAFNATGYKDIVDHQINGYLATPFSVNDLSNGIAWIIQDDDRWKSYSRCARDKVESTFSSKVVSERYVSLYRDLLGPKGE